MTPCNPSRDCGHADTCAHRAATGPDTIDASATMTKRQPWCPMFIDRRGAALIGQDNPMTTNQTKIGRPRGSVSKAVESKIRQAGANGVTLEELRQALPDYHPSSIKMVVKNLRNRRGFTCKSQGRISVYLAPGVDADQAQQHFAERVAEAKRASCEIARQARLRYYHRRSIEDKARRKGQKEEADRIRAERIAAVARDKEARAAQRQAERDRKALLSASKRAEAALNNRLAKRIKGDGTHRKPAERKIEPPPPSITWGGVTVQKISHQPGRYEVLTVPSIFGRIGQYGEPASSCMARALA